MKTCNIVAGLAWSLALTAAHGEPSADDAQMVFARVSPSVVTIKTLDHKGADDGMGSGVVIGNALVVTNCHVVQAAASLRVASASGELSGKWVRQDPDRDICLLRVDGLSAPAVALRPSTSLSAGEPVFAVGNPLGLGLAVSRGLLTTRDVRNGHPLIVASAAVSPGSSGGGLFDREGKLVGITTAILGTGQNLNLVLSSDGLERLATEGKVPQPAAPPPADHRWNEEAVSLQKANDWPRLEAHARAWMATRPRAADAFTFLGLAQGAQGRPQEAAASLKQAVELDDHNAFGWLQYAATLRSLGRKAEAEKALGQVMDLQPGDGQSKMLRADWLRAEGRQDEARREIKEALRLTPGQSQAWRTLGLIEDARGDTGAAQQAFQTALRLGEEDAEMKQRLAQILAASGKPDDASRLASSGGEHGVSTTQLAIGLAELKRGRLGPAEDALRKAVAINPASAENWSGLGNVLTQVKRLAEAEAAFDRAVQLAPNNVEMLTNRAITRRTLGRKNEALEDARRATVMAPNFAPAWAIYGVTLADQRQFREAAAAFTKMDELGKTAIGDLVNMGDIRAEAGDTEGALKTLARAEAIDPRHVGMCVTTAKVLGRKGDIAQALGYLERALKEDPTNVNAWSSKGYSLLKLGRLPEAVEALETTVRLGPDFANGWINLGEAQLRSKNLGQAIPALERAIVLAPAAADARFYLSQAYLAARLPAKSREHAQFLLARQQVQIPAQGIIAMSYLLEGDSAAAKTAYLKLKAAAPAVARNLREQAIASKLPAAMELPE